MKTTLIDLTITDVKLPKEIPMSGVLPGTDLYANMMRNRAIIHASASFEAHVTDNRELLTVRMWEDFTKDIRKFCDENNVGLYAISTYALPATGGPPVSALQSHKAREIDWARGHLSICFEDHEDFARFLKARAVMFKLSSY